MKHYHICVDYIDTALRTRTIGEIQDAVDEFEKDQKIRTNMIGDVPWSLVNWIRATDKLTSGKGQLNLTYNEDRELTSASATVVEKVNPNGVIEEARLCARMWVRPDFRNHQMVAKYHTLPGMVFAAQEKIRFAWISFNTDRENLIRRIEMLKHNSDPMVARIWRDWTVQKGLATVNNVPQFLLYRVIEPYWANVKLHPLPTSLID